MFVKVENSVATVIQSCYDLFDAQLFLIRREICFLAIS